MTVEDRDPQRAADMANRMVELLDQTSRTLKETRAGRTAEFVHRQLAERELMLAAAEDSLKRFQQEHHTVDMDEQLRSAMDIVTTLSSRAIALETEMQIMVHYTSTNSEEYQRKQTEYNEVLAQLRKLKVDVHGSDHDLVRSYIPTLQTVPEVALQYLRLRREVEIQNTVFTMLTNEYEKARIEQARDTPVVQVLDKAEKPISPPPEAPRYSPSSVECSVCGWAARSRSCAPRARGTWVTPRPCVGSPSPWRAISPACAAARTAVSRFPIPSFPARALIVADHRRAPAVLYVLIRLLGYMKYLKLAAVRGRRAGGAAALFVRPRWDCGCSSSISTRERFLFQLRLRRVSSRPSFSPR